MRCQSQTPACAPLYLRAVRLRLGALASIMLAACGSEAGVPPPPECLGATPLTIEFRELSRAPSNYRDLFALIDPRHPEYTYGFRDKRARSAWFKGPNETIGYCSYSIEPDSCFKVVAVYGQARSNKWELQKMVGQGDCGLILPETHNNSLERTPPP